jgi:hypothetical protein
MNPLPCLICGTALDNACGENSTAGYPINQPSGATAFETAGHYGSTIFDTLDTYPNLDQLEIAICDECLRPRLDRTRVLRQTPPVVVDPALYFTPAFHAR